MPGKFVIHSTLISFWFPLWRGPSKPATIFLEGEASRLWFNPCSPKPSDPHVIFLVKSEERSKDILNMTLKMSLNKVISGTSRINVPKINRDTLKLFKRLTPKHLTQRKQLWFCSSWRKLSFSKLLRTWEKEFPVWNNFWKNTNKTIKKLPW